MSFLGSTVLNKMIWGESEPYNNRPILDYRFENQYVVIRPYNEIGESYDIKLNAADVYYAKSIINYSSYVV